jgi:ketosteroid isomerase-like protein
VVAFLATRARALARALALAACGGGGAPGRVDAANHPETDGDPALSLEALQRDLEATVLEGYSQLTLGNLDAYADLLAEDIPVVILRTGPRQVWIGERPAEREKYLRIDPCSAVYTKNLEVHLAADGSMGWTFDEVSCRVPDPFQGRLASIPLRITGLYQRALDHWALVMEHVSYPQQIDDLLVDARAGRLPPLAPILPEAAGAPDGVRGVRSLLEKLITDVPTYRQFSVAHDPGALLVWPGPDEEYRGDAIGAAPALEELFGDGATVTPQGLRVALAKNRRLAFVAGNLLVKTNVGGDEVTLGLRGTWVFELRDDVGWVLLQTHVSAPIQQGELTRRIFGLELPDLDRLPVP